jgi:hypothetical protein
MKTKIFMMILFLLGVFGSGQVWAACIQDPIGYWTLDQNSSPYINEMTTGLQDPSERYDGTCTGAGCPVANNNGRVDGAQEFDGNDDSISITDNGTAFFDRGTADSFSISVWFRREAAAAWSENEVLVGRYHINQTHFWVGLANSTGHARFRLWDNASFGNPAGLAEGSVDLADGQWHQIVGVRNGQTNQNFLYVDGAQVDVIPMTYTGTFVGDTPMTIGSMNGQYFFDGDIDEVAFFHEALTADIVTEMFNAGDSSTAICTDNMPPHITSEAPTTATVGVEYTYNPTATDPDQDPLTWSLVNAPAEMVIDETTGAITWTPPAGTTTSGLITLTVADEISGQHSQDFTITVDDGTSPPPNNNGKGGGSSSGGGCFIDTIFQ